MCHDGGVSTASPVEVEPTLTPDEVTVAGDAVGDHRLERPGQPDVLRHLRLPEVLRLRPQEGREADAGGARGRQVGGEHRAAARRWSATCRPCTSTACGPRCRRTSDAAMSGFARHRTSRRVIANFTGFEADLLRSLAGQLIELLRNERGGAGRDGRPARGAARLLRPDLRARGPGPARGSSPRRTTATPRPPRSSGGSPRARCATARRRPRARSSTGSEEAGLPPELDQEGLMIDVELDEPTAETWMRSFTDLRLALATRLEVEEGDEDYWADPPRRRPPRRRPRHLRVGRLPPGDPGRRPDALSQRPRHPEWV